MTPSNKPKSTAATSPWGRDGRSVERHLRRALEGLRYGSVELVVHDSAVVQIIRTRTRQSRA